MSESEGVGPEDQPEDQELTDGDEEDSPFLIVDVDEPQSVETIEALRDGEGPLADSLYEVLEDLHAQGYIGDEVLPVVFVVRERRDDEEE